MQHVSAPIPSVRSLVPEAPEALETLITSLLAKEVEDRPATADDVRTSLIAIARALDSSATFETIDPVSGEYNRAPSRPELRPLMTPDPITRTSLAGNTPTVVRQSLRAPRWPWVAGSLAVVVIVFALIGLAITEPKPTPIATTPTAPVVVEPIAPVVKVEPPVVTPPPVDTVDPLPVVVTPPTPPVVVPPKVRPTRVAPSAVELQKRVAGLEHAIARATPAGEEPDPSALTLLRKYKVEATMVDSVEDRQRLAESLKSFEQTFLHR